MTSYRINKSYLRQFLLGVAGVLLLLAAIDILWLHKISSTPLTNDLGELTTRGQAWRRTDLIWGTLFMITGGALFAMAAVGLASARAVAEISADGLRLRVAGPNRMLTLRWADLVGVRSGLVDGDGARPRPVLIVEVEDPTRYPYELWGAEWINRVLYVDADAWAEPPEELAVRVQLDLEQWRRHHAGETANPDGSPVDPDGPATSTEGPSGDPMRYL